jgi:methylenetetrahydrofolate reductase (NADPH)
MTDTAMTETALRFSFEFFPPKTPQGLEKLLQVQQSLSAFSPDFYSVTYGAGGSTRTNTFNAVKAIQSPHHAVAPHISFGGDNQDAIAQLLQEYAALGVTRLVALRGDKPSGMGLGTHLVYANELVAFIREKTGDLFHIDVAAYPEIHPEASSFDSDIHYLKGKFDAGANSAITQYFYNPDAYFYFLDSCHAQGISAPIYPGIMPITHYQNLSRFSANCGAEIPRWIRKKLEGFGDDMESIKAFGLDVVGELCELLLENGAPGLHFYTMNNTEPTRQLLLGLGLTPRSHD